MFVNFNGKLVATSMTLGPCFQAPLFGMCNMVPNMPKPCACMVTKWDLADNSVTINRIAHPLTKNSRGTCALGTPMCISFTMTGQFPIPGVPGIVAPSVALQSDMTSSSENTAPDETPTLIKIEARSPEGKLVTEVPEDGYVTLVGLTKGHKEGDEVSFSLKDSRTYDGYVEEDTKAYARNCYLGEPKEGDGNGASAESQDAPVESAPAKSSESKANSESTDEQPKDKIADALLADEEAMKNIDLAALGRDAWDKPEDGFAYDLEHGNINLHGLSKAELNYGTPENNPYYSPPKSIYVVRYTTKKPHNARIPVHSMDEVPVNMQNNFIGVGDNNKYPFTGNGFTPSTMKKGGLGTPEVMVSKEHPQPIEKAIIVRIDSDGKETIVGYKTEVVQEDGSRVPQYVCVDEDGNYVE